MVMVQEHFNFVIDNYYYWEERIIQLRLKVHRGYLTVIGVYSHIEGKEDEN